MIGSEMCEVQSVWANEMREGHMDKAGFLLAAMIHFVIYRLCGFSMKASLCTVGQRYKDTLGSGRHC